MSSGKLRIAFLIGRDDAGTQNTIARIAESPHVEILAVLLDTARTPPVKRWRNLRRNIRREGLAYIPQRLLSALRQKLESLADSIIPRQEVEQLIDAAFPARNLRALAARYGFEIFQAGNLNDPLAVEFLRSLDADLGVVLGTRVLKPAVFAVPKQGCINLHKGRVPEYRGMPPGFWELYDGQESAGVTVHFVDEGLDTGDVLGTSEIPIHPKETPESLRAKLDAEGARLITEVAVSLALGTAVRKPQPPGTWAARTRPTRAQTTELARRLPHWRRLSDLRQSVKIAVWLLLFHTGVFALVRRRHAGKNRGAILLYHRVNDVSEDVLTASTRRFAQHLVTLRRYYRVAKTEEIVESVARGSRLPSASVAIHFDDCYRDVRTCAAPLLAAANAPATAFVSSGFVDTDRVFAHDKEKYPHRFENLHTADLCELPALGVAVGAHTVNHVDLGAVSLEQARIEVEDSGRQLEQMISHPVELFSFPFGRLDNIRTEVRELVMKAGYRALFSAYGGFIDESTSLFDIPRFGVSSDHSPLALLMELEGLSPNRLTDRSGLKSAR